MVEILNGTSQYCSEAIVSNAASQNEFHYSDAGYCIIEQLIADVVGKPFHQVVCEHIFEPLHMENSFLNPKLLLSNTSNIAVGHNKMGEIVNGKYPVYPYPAASGLWTTSENLAKLCIEFMNSLNEASTIGLSKTLAEEMIHPQGGKSWTGLGVFLEGTGMDLEISSLGWGGGFQSMVVMFPHRNKGAVILTNSELGVHQMEGFIGEVYKSLF